MMNLTNPNLDLSAALKVSAQPQGRILGIHPTASNPVKYYPLHFWNELLDSCMKDFDQIQIFCGSGQAEIGFCKEIKGKRSGISIHAGLEFGKLAEALGATSFFIGSDSSLMHLAAMMGKRVLGLWSFANFNVIFPYGDQVQILVPTETLTSKKHEYPGRPPAYLLRAQASQALKIIHDSAEPNFKISPAFVKPIRFYTF
jgi:ADP-heptose:LPS heptosyltransferase